VVLHSERGLDGEVTAVSISINRLASKSRPAQANLITTKLEMPVTGDRLDSVTLVFLSTLLAADEPTFLLMNATEHHHQNCRSGYKPLPE